MQICWANIFITNKISRGQNFLVMSLSRSFSFNCYEEHHKMAILLNKSNVTIGKKLLLQFPSHTKDHFCSSIRLNNNFIITLARRQYQLLVWNDEIFLFDVITFTHFLLHESLYYFCSYRVSFAIPEISILHKFTTNQIQFSSWRT